MHEQSVHTLEFPKVLAQLAEETGFSVGRERALELEPTSDPAEASRLLAFTSEAVRLLEERPGTGVGSARDIRAQVRRAARQGDLTATDLVAVVETLRSARHVSRLLADLSPERYPRMCELAERLPVHAELIARLEGTVDDEGNILDIASPQLRRLRSDRASAEGRLQQRVRTLVTEFGDALQEPIVTMRGDRYVVPVKADFRGRVRGIVHDQSASGATVYVEPMAVVELNNQLREIQAQEMEEVRRILRGLGRDRARRGADRLGDRSAGRDGSPAREGAPRPRPPLPRAPPQRRGPHPPPVGPASAALRRRGPDRLPARAGFPHGGRDRAQHRR
jgi:DNA mismatch repair protein MutS2